MVNYIAACIIFFWATWCVLSPSVNDGVIGKVIYAAIAFSALSIATAPLPEISTHAGKVTMLHLSIAALALRHIFLKLVWSHVVAFYDEHLRGYR